MPFKSEQQRKFMYAKHPSIAKRWSKEYPNQGKLPKKVKKSKMKHQYPSEVASLKKTRKNIKKMPKKMQKKIKETY